VVGEAAGDGVADVVEAGLIKSQLTVAAVVSFDSTELTSTRTNSLNRIFFSQALHNANVALKPAHGNTSHVITGST